MIGMDAWLELVCMTCPKDDEYDIEEEE